MGEEGNRRRLIISMIYNSYCKIIMYGGLIDSILTVHKCQYYKRFILGCLPFIHINENSKFVFSLI